MWIEIFKTGRHTSSNGKILEFTAEDLDKIVEKYNHRATDDTLSLAPLVKGHPQSNEPAYGWVERLARRGNYLLAKLRNLSSEIIEEVRQKKFQRVSISLTNDLELKHVGLLGAAQPAVEGLLPISFVNLDELIELEYSQSNDSFTYIINQNNDLKEKIEQYERTFVKRDIIEFATNLVTKKIIPQNQKQSAVELMELAYEIDRKNAEEFNFLDKIKSFFNKLEYSNLQNEIATNRTANKFGDFGDKRDLIKNREKLHNTVMEYLEQNPELTYEQALKTFIQ